MLRTRVSSIKIGKGMTVFRVLGMLLEAGSTALQEFSRFTSGSLIPAIESLGSQLGTFRRKRRLFVTKR